MISFKKPELEDRNLINSYLAKQKSRSCESTFANNYLWSRFYQVGYAVIEDTLVFRSNGETPSYTFPLGAAENVKTALERLMELCRQEGDPFQLYLVTKEQFARLEELYPGEFQIEYSRDQADYVYEREKLANLSGKKYHGKKNHVNKFMRTYPDWTYETIDQNNREECFQMALRWRELNGCEDDSEKVAEICVTLNYLRLFEELKMSGGLLKVNGQVVAFTIGERVCDDTFVVHIEKAFADIQGAYTMINQQFVLHETEGYAYINREEDTGAEGLRKAKLSYHPVFMVDKGIVMRKS